MKTPVTKQNQLQNMLKSAPASGPSSKGEFFNPIHSGVKNLLGPLGWGTKCPHTIKWPKLMENIQYIDCNIKQKILGNLDFVFKKVE